MSKVNLSDRDKKILDIVKRWSKVWKPGVSSSFARYHEDVLDPTIDHISKVIKLKPSQVKYSIDKLRKAGLVKKETNTSYTGYFYTYYVPGKEGKKRFLPRP